MVYAEDNLLFRNGDRLSGKLWIYNHNYAIIQSVHGNYKIKAKHIRSVTFDGLRSFRLFLKKQEHRVIRPIYCDSQLIRFQSEGKVSQISWRQVLLLRIMQE
ncbi:MAG: hypothetical protein AAF518_19670 [Spirochaetota bacterium]